MLYSTIRYGTILYYTVPYHTIPYYTSMASYRMVLLRVSGGTRSELEGSGLDASSVVRIRIPEKGSC